MQLPDHELQSIVYRVVPGLYEDEMRRRREYYENNDERSDEHTEEKGFPERVILSDKDKVSVVLVYRDNEEYPKLYVDTVSTEKSESRCPHPSVLHAPHRCRKIKSPIVLNKR